MFLIAENRSFGLTCIFLLFKAVLKLPGVFKKSFLFVFARNIFSEKMEEISSGKIFGK